MKAHLPYNVRESRAELLAIGATVLHSRLPQWQATFRASGFLFRARFAWPGVLTVTDDNTGEPVARSLLGRPGEPDADTLAAQLRDGRP